ncbi:hypothetical protein J4450_03535 [Candidatus Micrarchaeota archaeon]|nr:hypothetical protein [Candidatus Micrarchaeota archaeon]
MPKDQIPKVEDDILSISPIIPTSKGKKYKYMKPVEKQKRKVYTNLGTVVVILIITIAIFFLFFGKKPADNGSTNIAIPNVTKPNVSVSTVCDDDCQLQNALSTKVATTCDSISNETKKQDCFVALATDSVEACLKLADYSQKKTCVGSHAVKLDNLDLCSNLEMDDRRPCIEKVDSCFYKKLDEKPLCKALANNNYSFCEKNEECIFAYAQQTVNAEACADLGIRFKQNACVSIALKKDECNGLPKDDEIDACRALYAVKTDRPGACDDLTKKDTIYAVNCYAHFAKRDKNPAVCDGVELLKRWDCYKKYAIETSDLQGCIQITRYAPIAKEHCFIDVGKEYGNPQACEYLNFDPGSRDVCYRASIQDNLKLRHENCANLSSDEWDVRCYTNAAKLEQNVTVCDLQDNQVDVNFCRTNYK